MIGAAQTGITPVNYPLFNMDYHGTPGNDTIDQAKQSLPADVTIYGEGGDDIITLSDGQATIRSPAPARAPSPSIGMRPRASRLTCRREPHPTGTAAPTSW
jgi:hypothetical protein